MDPLTRNQPKFQSSFGFTQTLPMHSHHHSHRTGADIPARHHYFQHHARYGASLKDSMGHFGDEEHRSKPVGDVKGGSLGNVYGGSAIATNPAARFASRKVNNFHPVNHAKRRIVDLIEDISSSKEPQTRTHMNHSRVRRAIDDIESKTRDGRRFGKRNAIDNIEDMKNGARGSARSAIRSVEYGLMDKRR